MGGAGEEGAWAGAGAEQRAHTRSSLVRPAISPKPPAVADADPPEEPQPTMLSLMRA